MNVSRANIYSESKSDVYDGIENARGSNFDDTIIGDSGVNKIYGSYGNDFIQGMDGNDIIGNI